MKNTKRILILACVLLMILALPVSATESAPTLAPRVEGVLELTKVPESWSPLGQLDDDQRAILSLTSETLYKVDSEGQIQPAQAAELPQDVTAHFAGNYGIPSSAVRGYAYAIALREGACWDDGRVLTAGDWTYTLEMLLERDLLPLDIANYHAYRQGETGPAAQIVSLEEAGYKSMEEAQAAGIQDFYVETNVFWGLDAGWLRATDRTRLYDPAIPSGCEEMYVTPAYLFKTYLSNSGALNYFQKKFLGIPAADGAPMTMADVGLLVWEDQLVIILQERTTASQLALALSNFYPIQQGAKVDRYGTPGYYTGCGEFRIVSANKDQIIMVPSAFWTGETAEVELELVRCYGAS